MKHGERSRRAFFPLDLDEDVTPLVAMRIRNLLVAEDLGQMREAGFPERRVKVLLEGMMRQLINRIIRLEKQAVRDTKGAALAKAKRENYLARRELARIRREIRLEKQAKRQIKDRVSSQP